MGSAGRNLLPVVVHDFRARYPRVALEVREITLPETNRAVRDGTVDAAFVRPIDDDSELELAWLPSDGLLAVLPLGHRLAGSASLQVSDLSAERFVRPNAASVLGPWMTFLATICDRHGFRPRFSATEASSLQAIVGLVAARDGVSIMSATTHTLPREGVVAVPIGDESMPLALAWRRADRSQTLARFVSLVREAVPIEVTAAVRD